MNGIILSSPFLLLQAVFVGHNHGLDWCCPYKKLWLCYARHTGYGGYGNWPRGARIIEITQQPFSIKSWIRMEDGVVHSRVTLSPWVPSRNIWLFTFVKRKRGPIISVQVYALHLLPPPRSNIYMMYICVCKFYNQFVYVLYTWGHHFFSLCFFSLST